MTQLIKKIAVGVIMLATMTGCATVPDPAWDDQPADTETASRTKKTLITIGGILLLGVILANTAEDNVEDAVRDATGP